MSVESFNLDIVIKSEPDYDISSPTINQIETESVPDEDICLQRFLNTDITIDEEIKEENIFYTQNAEFKCDRCNFSTHLFYTYQCHIEMCNNPSYKPEFMCMISDIDDHNVQEKTFICTVCSKSWRSSIHLDNHMRVHTGEKPYKCLICHKMFSQTSNLNRHFKMHVEDKTHDLRKNRSMDEENYLQHFLNTDITTDEKYNISGMDDIQERTMNDKAFVCTICNKSWMSLVHLDNHMRVHTGEKPYKCLICHKKFSQTSNLNRHFRQHIEYKTQNLRITRNMKLNSSDEEFNDSTINIDVSSPKSKPLHKCKHCGKICKFQNTLYLHMKIHTTQRPLRHLVNHSNKKVCKYKNIKGPISCKNCNRSFKYICNLVRHMNTHSKLKFIRCTICNDIFKESAQLDKHLKLHAEQNIDLLISPQDENSFKCKVCGTFSKVYADLIQHIKTRHQNLVNDDNLDVVDLTGIENSQQSNYITNSSTKASSISTNIAPLEDNSSIKNLSHNIKSMNTIELNKTLNNYGKLVGNRRISLPSSQHLQAKTENVPIKSIKSESKDGRSQINKNGQGSINAPKLMKESDSISACVESSFQDTNSSKIITRLRKSDPINHKLNDIQIDPDNIIKRSTNSSENGPLKSVVNKDRLVKSQKFLKVKEEDLVQDIINSPKNSPKTVRRRKSELQLLGKLEEVQMDASNRRLNKEKVITTSTNLKSTLVNQNCISEALNKGSKFIKNKDRFLKESNLVLDAAEVKDRSSVNNSKSNTKRRRAVKQIQSPALKANMGRPRKIKASENESNKIKDESIQKDDVESMNKTRTKATSLDDNKKVDMQKEPESASEAGSEDAIEQDNGSSVSSEDTDSPDSMDSMNENPISDQEELSQKDSLKNCDENAESTESISETPSVSKLSNPVRAKRKLFTSPKAMKKKFKGAEEDSHNSAGDEENKSLCLSKTDVQDEKIMEKESDDCKEAKTASDPEDNQHPVSEQLKDQVMLEEGLESKSVLDEDQVDLENNGKLTDKDQSLEPEPVLDENKVEDQELEPKPILDEDQGDVENNEKIESEHKQAEDKTLEKDDKSASGEVESEPEEKLKEVQLNAEKSEKSEKKSENDVKEKTGAQKVKTSKMKKEQATKDTKKRKLKDDKITKRKRAPKDKHKCEVCKKVFKQSAHLTIHMRVHTGEKPFKCSVCDKTFTNKSNMNKHVKQWHDEKK